MYNIYIYIYIYIGLTPGASRLSVTVAQRDLVNSPLPFVDGHNVFTDGLYTQGTRARTHRELIREWLWEPNVSSLEYI